MATNCLRPQLNCVTEHLSAVNLSHAANSPECPAATDRHISDCAVADSQGSLSPSRPALYLFPRDNPDAPFVPLPTRQFFRTAPARVEDLDSDSEFSDWYESSDDEDSENGSLPRPQGGPSVTRSQVLSIDNLPQKLTLSISNLPTILVTSQPIKKSALKQSNSSVCSPASSTTSCFSSNISPNSSSYDGRARSALSGVQVVEPLEELSALRDLRKTFRYRHMGPLPPHVNLGLPSSPKDALNMNRAINFQVFQRTPPATSSAARLEWQRKSSHLSEFLT